MRKLLLAFVFLAQPALAQTAPVTSAGLARRHAPLFKFNAWQDGDSSPMNKTEDHYPQSVARFLDELASGEARVVARESRKGRAASIEKRPIRGHVAVEKDRIAGMPRNMAGDEPGRAPVYFHAYAKEGLTYVEYWLFYPQDRCRVKVLGVPLAVGGHRGDWEGISVALDGNGEIVRAYFNRHTEKNSLSQKELRFEDGHPVVYVSQGKHACYPEPGKWHDVYAVAPFMEFDEFFLGNGFAWRSWESTLVDLDQKESAELAPESWKKLSQLPSWLDFPGGWGPDKPVFGIGGSPVGPKQHGTWGAGSAGSTPWSEVRERPGIELSSDKR